MSSDPNEREFEAAAYFGLNPSPSMAEPGGWYDQPVEDRAAMTAYMWLKNIAHRLNDFDYRRWRKLMKIED